MISLRYRIAGAIIAIEIAMSAVLIFDDIRVLRDTYTKSLENSAASISRQFAATASRYLFEFDVASLAEHADLLLANDELVYITVYDQAGLRVLAAGSPPPRSTTVPDGAVAGPGEGFYEVESPIEIAGRPLGVAHLGFSFAALEAALESAVNRGILVAGALVILSMIVALAVGSRLTRDLRKLAAGAERFGRGEVDVSIDVRGRDEVGQTAVAFNKMVADRRLADASLRDSERQFRALIENALDMIGVLQADGTFNFVSPSVETTLGYRRNELIGRNAMELIAPENRAEVLATLKRAVDRPGQVESVAFQVRHADGSLRQLEADACSHVDNPTVGGVVVNARDVTDRREIEAQLRHSQKLEAIGGLSGGMAHDFNNLLAVISGNLELITEQLEDRPALREMANRALRAAERGASLTRSLLAFSRQQSLSASDIDLNAVIDEMSEMIRRTIPANIEVRLLRQDDLWLCRVDPGQLQNALVNLVLNACDAMPDGGILSVESANVDLTDAASAASLGVEPGAYVSMTVSDNGIGMDPEVVNRAFEPFFSTKDVGKGSGLGLSMIYGFAKQSAGLVHIASAVGVGTRVTIYLPRSKTAPAPDRIAEVRLPATGSEKVLVVEDDSDVLDLVVMQLSGLGYAVFQARDGDEGLNALAVHRDIVLLLSDVMLPGNLKGPALIQRALTLNPNLRVILMSGYADDSVFSDGVQEVDVTLLRKPFARAELARAIRTVLDA